MTTDGKISFLIHPLKVTMGTKVGSQAVDSPLVSGSVAPAPISKYISGVSTFKSHCSHQISNMITLTSTMDKKREGYDEGRRKDVQQTSILEGTVTSLLLV